MINIFLFVYCMIMKNPILSSDYSTEYKDLPSGIVDMDPWRNIRNKNTLSDDENESF